MTEVDGRASNGGTPPVPTSLSSFSNAVPSDRTAPKTPPRDPWYEKHFGLLVAASLTMAIALKVMMVAHGDATTVAVLVRSASLGDLGMAVFLIGLPVVGWMPLILVVGQFTDAVREHDSLLAPSVLLLAALALAVIVMPARYLGFMVLYLLAMLLAGLIFIPYDRWRRKRGSTQITRRNRSQARRHLLVGGTMYPALILVVIFASDRPWLPIERIELASGDTVTGYVLGSEDGWSSIMRHDNRRVLRVSIDAIKGRQFCSPNEHDMRPLIARIIGWDSPHYERCP